MIRRPPRSTPLYSSAASDVYKRQPRGNGKSGGVIEKINSFSFVYLKYLISLDPFKKHAFHYYRIILFCAYLCICQFPAFICKYRNKRFTFLDHFALFLVYPDPCSIISGGARDPCKLHNALVIELNDIAISRGRKVSPVLPGFDISMDNIWISALDFNDLFEFFKCFPRTQRFHSYLFSTTSRGHTPHFKKNPCKPCALFNKAVRTLHGFQYFQRFSYFNCRTNGSANR